MVSQMSAALAAARSLSVPCFPLLPFLSSLLAFPQLFPSRALYSHGAATFYGATEKHRASKKDAL